LHLPPAGAAIIMEPEDAAGSGHGHRRAAGAFYRCPYSQVFGLGLVGGGRGFQVAAQFFMAVCCRVSAAWRAGHGSENGNGENGVKRMKASL
jgi:hypothetical protein